MELRIHRVKKTKYFRIERKIDGVWYPLPEVESENSYKDRDDVFRGKE